MPGMIFRPDLAQAVMDGRKTVTRRLVREDNPRSPWSPERAPKLVGKRLAVQPGRGCSSATRGKTFTAARRFTRLATSGESSSPTQLRRAERRTHDDHHRRAVWKGERMSETRLVAIDAETVERIRAWAKSAREEVDAARSILAAWEEGVEIPDPARSQSPARFVAVWMGEGEAQHCLDVLRELDVNLDIEWPERVFSLFESAVEEGPRRTYEQMQAEQEIAYRLTDPAPQEAE